IRESAVEAPLSEEVLPELARVAGTLGAEARAELEREGVADGGIRSVRRVHLRYEGTDTALPVPMGRLGEMVEAFEAAYRQPFSFLRRDKALGGEAVSVELRGPAGPLADSPGEIAPGPPAAGPHPAGRVPIFFSGSWTDVDLFRRADLRPGHVARGPAIIVEDFATTVVEPGWQAAVTGRSDLLLTRAAAGGFGGPPRNTAAQPAPGGEDGQARPPAGADPVMLEIFNNLFMSVAEQMGGRLQATAHSVNIKERLDFSCAIFDADGNLIANAPHIPVHLGSMGESIKIVVQRNAGHIRRGDVYTLNDPYHGGTHLPDITVVTPVFGDEGTGRENEILFYV